jgi:hypothetical protein
MTSVREAVAEKLATSGETVKGRVVDLMVEETLKKRVGQVMSAMTERDNLEKDLRKLKPDVLHYDESGAPAATLYSKVAIEQRKKVTDRIAKVEKAIAKALDENDFGDVMQLGGKEPPKDASGDAAAAS